MTMIIPMCHQCTLIDTMIKHSNISNNITRCISFVLLLVILQMKDDNGRDRMCKFRKHILERCVMFKYVKLSDSLIIRYIFKDKNVRVYFRRDSYEVCCF